MGPPAGIGRGLRKQRAAIVTPAPRAGCTAASASPPQRCRPVLSTVDRVRHTAVLVAWATAATVLLIDQLTKAWAVVALEGQPGRQIVGDLLRLSFVRNSGAAFGLGAGATIVFSLLAIVVAVVLVRMSTRLVSTWWAVALGLMLGGALGNLIDRVFRAPAPLQGHVVDFLRLPNWPVFNVADMSLVTAAVLIVGLSLLNVPYDRPRESTEDPAAA